MIKALLLIFSSASWDRVANAHRRMGYVLFVYLLPMMVLAGAAEGAGLVHWGKWQPGIAQIRLFSTSTAMLYEVCQLLLMLAVVFICAHVVKTMSDTFHNRQTYTQAFTLVAYGLSPVFLLRLLDAFPMVSPWVTWGIGIVLAMAIIYPGLPRVLQPDPTHAFGLYFMSALIIFLITGMERLFTGLYLQGRVDLADSYLGIKLSHILGIHF
jgi:hypothetical protein